MPLLAPHRLGLQLLVCVSLPFYLLNMKITERICMSKAKHIAKKKQNERQKAKETTSL